MDKETIVNDTALTLDSETWHSGGSDLDASEKRIRKAIGLPVKKQLVYYSDKTNAQSAIAIHAYRIKECYNKSDAWFVLEVMLENDSTVDIHSSYLIEMQKPSFIADMAMQEAIV